MTLISKSNCVGPVMTTSEGLLIFFMTTKGDKVLNGSEPDGHGASPPAITKRILSSLIITDYRTHIQEFSRKRNSLSFRHV